MKKIKFILLLLIGAFCFSCTKCPQHSAVEPDEASFHFSVVDKNGNDLFFGNGSIYDSHNVKLVEYQGNFGVFEDENCFLLKGFYPQEKPYLFFIELIPNDTDTLVMNVYESAPFDECTGFGILHTTVYFNDSLICNDCSDNEIYKIIKK